MNKPSSTSKQTDPWVVAAAISLAIMFIGLAVLIISDIFFIWTAVPVGVGILVLGAGLGFTCMLNGIE